MAQSVLRPIQELPPGALRVIVEEVKSALMAAATAAIPGVTLIVRDLLPTDIGYANENFEETTGGTANVYEEMTKGEVPDKKYIILFGVKDLSPTPSVSALKFTIGATDVQVWHLQKLHVYNEPAGVAAKAIHLSPGTKYLISRYVILANAKANLVLEGFVAELAGTTVSP